MLVNLAIALSVPSRSVKSYNSLPVVSPDAVEGVTATPAMFALTSGSTIMLTPDANGVLECPVASDNDVL